MVDSSKTGIKLVVNDVDFGRSHARSLASTCCSGKGKVLAKDLTIAYGAGIDSFSGSPMWEEEP